MADLLLPRGHTSILDGSILSSRSQVCSPALKRKHVTHTRSKSLPSTPIREKQKPKTERKQLNIAWTIDAGSFVKTNPVKAVHGSDLKVASVALYNNRSLLEAVIVESVLKIQRQNYLSKIFSERHDVQTSLWQKIKWYHTKGYVFAIIRIMREWINASKSTLWCKEHSMNMPFLTTIWNQCKSIYAALCSANKEKCPNVQTFDNLSFERNEEEMETFLEEVLIKNFGQNLCFYRGTKAAGYYCCNKNTSFQVDFISGCNKLGNLPEYIIPLSLPKSKIIKCFLPINKNRAMSISSCHHLDFVSLMNQKRLCLATSLELGSGHKRRLLLSLQRKISSKFGTLVDDIFFDTDISNSLDIYTPSKISPDMVDMAEKCVAEIQEELQRGHLHIQKDISSNMFKGTQYMKQHLSLKIKPGGYCDSIQVNDQKNVLQVTCEKQEDLYILIEESKQICDDISIYPIFIGHSLSGLYISCTTDEQKEQILQQLEEKQCIIQNITISQFSKYMTDDLYKHCFNECHLTGIVKLKTTSQADRALLMEHIHKVLLECFGKQYRSIVNVLIKPLLRGSEASQDIDVQFFFLEAKAAEDHIKALSSRSVFGQRLVFANKDEINSKLCHIKLTLNSRVYTVLHLQLKKVVQTNEANIVAVKGNNYGKTEITICTKSANKRETLKRLVSSILSPVPVSLRHIGNERRDFLLSPQGYLFLESVMAQTKTCIHVYNNNSIKIHGYCRAKEIASNMIENVEINNKWISQSIEQNMGHFLTTVVPHVDFRTKTMSDLAGISKVVLDIDNGQVLYQINSAEKDITTTLDVLELDDIVCSIKAGERQCASCMRSIFIDAEPWFMLEICKHYYCPSCIYEQINVTIKSKIFPLMCAECNGEFCVTDLMNLARHIENFNMNRFINSAMQNCVSSNPDKYMFCPNNTCMLLLDISEDKKKVDSPTNTSCKCCNIEICIPCKSYIHKNMSCEENMQDIVTWINVDPKNRKRCPSCSMGIEKIDGCSNVGCTYCKKAICWKCNAFFGTEDLCYRHLRNEHGGYN